MESRTTPLFVMIEGYLDSQVAGNNRPLYPKVAHIPLKFENNGPLYPKVDHFGFKVAQNYEPLADSKGRNMAGAPLRNEADLAPERGDTAVGV